MGTEPGTAWPGGGGAVLTGPVCTQLGPGLESRQAPLLWVHVCGSQDAL